MMSISSTAFSNGGPIPRAHTCDGADQSPPLRFSGIPEGTKELALIVDDPDAPVGVFVHWVLYGLPPDVTSLPSGLPKDPTLAKPIRALQGVNDFRKTGYNGPCPPRGPAHRYFFKLYALDTQLNLPAGATKAVLLKAMEGHVLQEASLMGTYARA
ncbi:Putative lipoprotein LppC [bacterium HR33]|nr:Putative lipoprotein LppC [bacterium HR33]